MLLKLMKLRELIIIIIIIIIINGEQDFESSTVKVPCGLTGTLIGS